jgi:lipid-binding SYLF domain-containing protein
MIRIKHFALACVLVLMSSLVHAQKEAAPSPARAKLNAEAQKAIAEYRRTDPGIDSFFKNAAGYVVFPSVGKGGFIVAAGGGDGLVFDKGKEIGVASITIATVGLQAGGQEFSQIVFFETKNDLERFKGNHFEFAANASAVIADSGASKGAKYRGGVVVFTKSTKGAMAEAALGTQKFKFMPD